MRAQYVSLGVLLCAVAAAALGGCTGQDRGASLQAESMAASAPGAAGGAAFTRAPVPVAQRQQSFGRYTTGIAKPQPAEATSPAMAVPTRPVVRAPYSLHPNVYIASTYVGGTGEKERLEKLIDEGVMVDGKRVRLEAFTRSYHQTFPLPTRTALSVTADTERSRVLRDGGHTFLQVGIQAIEGEAPRRPPLNIALVIDRSGSMGDEQKLENAKAAAEQLVDRLRPTDTFAVIAFDDQAQVLLPSEPVGHSRGVKARIAALAPGGGTNIYEGLTLGYREARKHAAPEVMSRVILLSDGQVTAGVNDPRAFDRLVSVNADQDIQTTSIGLGMEFNEDLMLAIARQGRGSYHFIRSGDDTQRVFAKELEDLTHVVAKAVKLRIRLADGVGLVRVLGAAQLDADQTRQVKAQEKRIDRHVYEELGIAANRQQDRDEPGIKLLIPAFYRGDSHVVMLEVAVPPGQGARPVADVYLKYKDLVTMANREARATAAITYTDSRPEMVASVNRGVKKNLLGFQTGEALQEAAALMQQGRAADAVRRIDDRMVVLGVAAKEWQDRDLDRDGRLLDRYKTVLAQVARNPALSSGAYGEYLARALSYNGYQMTK